MTREYKFYICFVLAGTLIFGSVTHAISSNPETESCQEFKLQSVALHNDQVRAEQLAQNQRFQMMRANVLNLCHESFWANREQIVRSTWRYALHSPNFIDEIINRFEHGGVSDQVSNILNYPRLPEILHECYPGNGSTARWHRFEFKKQLAGDDKLAFQLGTVDGLVAMYVGYRAVKGLSMFTKLADAFKIPKLARSVLEGLAIFGGITAYQKWRTVKANENRNLRKIRANRARARFDRNSIADEPTATMIINALTANLTEQKIVSVQNFVNRLNQQYGGVQTTIPDTGKTDPFQFNNISMQINSYKSKCASSIKTYSANATPLNLQYIQMFCGNYLDAIENYLSRLKSPAVRCLNANNGVIYRARFSLRRILAQIPTQAIAQD